MEPQPLEQASERYCGGQGRLRPGESTEQPKVTQPELGLTLVVLPPSSGRVQSPLCVAAKGRLPTCLPEGLEVDSRHLSAEWNLPKAYETLPKEDSEAQRGPAR